MIYCYFDSRYLYRNIRCNFITAWMRENSENAHAQKGSRGDSVGWITELSRPGFSVKT